VGARPSAIVGGAEDGRQSAPKVIAKNARATSYWKRTAVDYMRKDLKKALKK